MNLNYDTSEPQVRAQIQLLKSHIEHKANLTYQISKLRIESSYKHSADSKDFKVMVNLGKMISKKLGTIRYISETLKKIRLKEVAKETLEDLMNCIKEFQTKLEVSRNVFSLNFEIETFVDELKEKYSQLTEAYSAKFAESNELQILMEDFDIRVRECENLEIETKDYLHEINHYKSEISDLTQKKNKMTTHRRESVEKVKIFQLLSPSALQLHSKYLLKDELIKSIKSAESELDNLNQEINLKKEKLEEFEVEKEDFIRNSARFEVDFYELRKKITKLEMQLEGLLRENEDLNPKTAIHSQGSLNEGETLSIPSIMTGLKQIQKEKASLFEENQVLKERLNKLIVSND